MKADRKAITDAVIGGIVILLTLAIFFFGNTKVQKENIDIAALLLVLLSEIILFGGMAALNLLNRYGDRVFVKSGIIATLSLYWVTAVVFSLLAHKSYTDNIPGFVTVHFVIFGIALIISILIAASYITVSENNQKIIDEGVLIKKCENTVKLLSANVNNLKYKDVLNRLYEDIKYGDKTMELEEDKLIFNQLTVLSDKLAENTDGDDGEIIKSIEGIRQTVKQRDLSIRELKRGGI